MRRLFLLCLFAAVPTVLAADGYGFRTPSGNINCNGAVIDGFIDCTIVERGGVPPVPRPGSCSGNWGHDFHLDATGPARMGCSSYALRKSRYSDVAGYGQSAEFGPITCRSERTGLTCRNRSGHGFFLSRRRQEMF